VIPGICIYPATLHHLKMGKIQENYLLWY